MRSKGGVVVVAAGNSGGLESISANDALLSVAATDSNDAKASFSSYGNYIDLAAPGVSIYTTTVGGGYSNANGTSFSSPITAATAALMMSANSKLSPADVDKIFKSTSSTSARRLRPVFGYGRIDAAKAVAAANRRRPPLRPQRPTPRRRPSASPHRPPAACRGRCRSMSNIPTTSA
jgi:thermitase